MRAEYGKSAYLKNIADREQQKENDRFESVTQKHWFDN